MEINKNVVEFAKKMELVKLPRWEDLPNIDYYNFQICEFIKQHLFFMNEVFGDNYLTPTMVNNYVKNGIIDKPKNKKYSKAAIAKLIVVSCLKQVLEISDIGNGIDLLINLVGLEKAYEIFIKSLNDAFKSIFGSVSKGVYPLNLEIKNLDSSDINVSLACLALASKVLIKKLILEDGFVVRKNI
ncbi:DUF1836 domain-containing protein [Peptoniphilus sp. GNH]|nr:hypothetical protein HMPREF3189_00055 [Clostridiales bacterium KA00134]UHR03021.1 DUF1836 domain-containing protein [Peptoniphilus sp. GNH]